MEVPLLVYSIVKIVSFIVVPSLCYGIILGSDFCSQFGIIIDYENNSWECGGMDTSEQQLKYTNGESISSVCSVLNEIHSRSE